MRSTCTLALTLALSSLALFGCATVRRHADPGAGDGAGAGAGAGHPAGRTTGFLFDTWHGAGDDLPYAVYVPRDYDPARPWPLILFLHGSGESGRDGTRMIVQGLGSAILWDAARWPAIVVFPQKPSENQEWEEHDAALMGILARVRETYTVDADRIYLTGLSQGGHGTWVLGARHADVWAALLPVCGYANSRRDGAGVFRGTAEDLAPRLAGLPIWAFHGEVDDVVPAQETREVVAAVRGVVAARGGVEPKMTILPGVNHGAWDPAYRDAGVAGWLLGQRRK